MQDEFSILQENAYTGLGSDFLKGEKEDIFSGKLNAKGKAKKGAQNITQKPNPKIQKFFTSFDKVIEIQGGVSEQQQAI